MDAMIRGDGSGWREVLVWLVVDIVRLLKATQSIIRRRFEQYKLL
jgi:hypothetical protein